MEKKPKSKKKVASKTEVLEEPEKAKSFKKKSGTSTPFKDTGLGLTRQVWTGTAQIRGEVKAKADDLIDKYDIISSTNKAIVKVRFHHLSNFNPQQPLSHEGIVRLLEKQWFKTGRSEGLRYFKKFNAIPNPLIALAMTSMEASLTQWEDGGLVKSQFSATKWRQT
ncbi:hypothetical protein JAAARDRAFT_201201 [Jaapia argillacea MUCL 33604]|nr:hypothetical protein JAAARDRAFT_201201 [Jaapia argillacea MUCL 33604]